MLNRFVELNKQHKILKKTKYTLLIIGVVFSVLNTACKFILKDYSSSITLLTALAVIPLFLFYLLDELEDAANGNWCNYSKSKILGRILNLVLFVGIVVLGFINRELYDGFLLITLVISSFFHILLNVSRKSVVETLSCILVLLNFVL